MTPSARIQSALDLLQQTHEQNKPSDALISAYFRTRRFIGSKDRAAIAEMVFEMLRHQARLGWWVRKLGQDRFKLNDIKAFNLKRESFPITTCGGDDLRQTMLVYLRLVKNLQREEIDKLFSGEKFSPAKLEPVEKEVLKFLDNEKYVHAAMSEDIRLECPPWAYEKLKAAFGENFADELQAMQHAAPLDLRVNTLKATREDVLAVLKKADVEAGATPLAPHGIRVKNRANIMAMEIYKNGHIEIQDEGSQLLAKAVDAKTGMSVVDFCAGAGGKTLSLAAAMENKGRLVACDVLEWRLTRARERFKRAGAHNITIHPLKNENDQWVKHNAGKFDRVLVDAPCSGSGTWRRNPDARWKNLGPDLAELLQLQEGILASASRLVKTGGKIIYATCSILPDENERQVEKFLATYPNFSLLPLAESYATHGMLKLSPHRYGTDGFFGAVMQKK